MQLCIAVDLFTSCDAHQSQSLPVTCALSLFILSTFSLSVVLLTNNEKDYPIMLTFPFCKLYSQFQKSRNMRIFKFADFGTSYQKDDYKSPIVCQYTALRTRQHESRKLVYTLI